MFLVTYLVKDVRTKIFQSIDLFKFLLQSDSELLVYEMEKKVGVIDFVAGIKCVEKYPGFEKLVRIIQHGLQGFIVKKYRW